MNYEAYVLGWNCADCCELTSFRNMDLCFSHSNFGILFVFEVGEKIFEMLSICMSSNLPIFYFIEHPACV